MAPVIDGRSELDEVLSPARQFSVGPRLRRLMGGRLAFAASHAIAFLRELPDCFSAARAWIQAEAKAALANRA